MPQATQRQLLGAIDQFVPPEIRGRQKQFFAYQSIFDPIAVGATAQDPVSMDNDSDFLVLAINGVVSNNAGLVQIAFPPLLIQLTYTGVGNNFYAQPDHFLNVVGSAEEPGLLLFPFLIPGGAVLQVTLQNLDPANTFDVRLSFQGAKYLK